MSPRTRPREEADRVLLESGPQSREDLILIMLPLIPPGKAARTANMQREWNRRRRSPHLVGVAEFKSKVDLYESGRRAIARRTIGNAVRRGAYVVDGEMIRHRDWRGVMDQVTAS